MSAAEGLKSAALEALEWMRRRAPAGLDAEIYLSRGRTRRVALRQSRLSLVDDARFSDAGLRIIQDGRAAFVSGAGETAPQICGLFPQALARMESSGRDYFRTLPDPVSKSSDSGAGGLDSFLWDESALSEPWSAEAERLQAACASARAADARIGGVLSAVCDVARRETFIVNTRGVRAFERGTYARAEITALAEQAGESQVGAAAAWSRRSGAFDLNRLGARAAQRACALLGASPLSGGKQSVIFDPWIAGKFLGLIADALRADRVHKGQSMLAGKRGLKIAAPDVSFVDDPRLPGGAASSVYDGEGAPTLRKTLVKGGILEDYLYDTQRANKDGRMSNAGAIRESGRLPPAPGASNFYLSPGAAKREDIIADTKKGLLVLDVMGMHTADEVSGEFSVAVSGVRVESGRLGRAVRSAMISGNFLDMLSRIDAVGGDLAFYGAMGSPTFRAAGLSVS